MLDVIALTKQLRRRGTNTRRAAGRLIAGLCCLLEQPSAKITELFDDWNEKREAFYGPLTSKTGPEGDEFSAGIRVSREKLLFAMGTLFALIAKEILYQVLDAPVCTDRERLLGRYAAQFGVRQYDSPDWFCWPVFLPDGERRRLLQQVEALCGGFRREGDRREFAREYRFDCLGQIYQSFLSSALRHRPGEYYTESWLAEHTVESLLCGRSGEEIRTTRILDPGCGSGAMLLACVRKKRKLGCTAKEILETVQGIDVNPLAQLAAKTTCLLAVADLLTADSPAELKIYTADLLLWDEVQPQSRAGSFTGKKPAAAVQARMNRERRAVKELPPFELIVGNPPWVGWDQLPPVRRQPVARRFQEYGLLAAKGWEKGFLKEDLSLLFASVTVDRFLQKGGRTALLLRQSLFRSARNGRGFRSFRIRGEIPVRVLRVEDWSRIHTFGGQANRTALLLLDKGAETQYPADWQLWEKTESRCSFGAFSEVSEVMSRLRACPMQARPASGDLLDPWITVEADRSGVEKLLGSNHYRARAGIFTGGANGIYRLDREQAAALEPDHLYPLLEGRGLHFWHTDWHSYLLCPHTAATRSKPVEMEQLRQECPRTAAYLEGFRTELSARNGFAVWEKQVKDRQFHALLRVGEYSFAPWKVVWKYIADRFTCAVIGSVEEERLGSQLLLPSEKVMFVPLTDPEEAFYLCGLLSSGPVSSCIESYMNPTSISASVLDRLSLPDFDRADPLHREIARLCREGHRTEEKASFRSRIDALVCGLYHIPSQEQGQSGPENLLTK